MMSYGNNRSEGRRSSKSNREYYDAVCADCGETCKVPFVPSENGKPVYCKDCYKKYAPDKKTQDNRRSMF